MRLQASLWSGLVVYYLVLAVIYVAVGGEAAGTTLLLLAAGFGGLGGGWLWRVSRTDPVDPSDRPELDVIDGPTDLGTFPAASLRPLAIGVGITGIVLGLAAGLWMTIVSIGILGSQVALLVWDEDRIPGDGGASGTRDP